MKRLITSATMVLAIGVNCARAADGAPQPTDAPRPSTQQPTSGLDDELLRDLESNLGEDDLPTTKKSGTRPMGGGSKRKVEEPADKKADDLLDDDALDGELMRELQQHSPEDDPNAPLTSIGRAMRDVEELVGRAKAGKPTQQMQDKIVADLERLLEEARRRQQKSSSSQESQSSSRQSASRQSRPGGAAGGASDKPAQDSSSTLRDRAAARPDPAEMQDLIRELWGHLPEHERQMVINSTVEQFLPKYELLIEAYFKRLAEQSSDR